MIRYLNRNELSMSKELQEKADKIVQELREALIPIRKEINTINSRNSGGRRI
jgi:hypothetical protein